MSAPIPTPSGGCRPRLMSARCTRHHMTISSQMLAASVRALVTVHGRSSYVPAFGACTRARSMQILPITSAMTLQMPSMTNLFARWQFAMRSVTSLRSHGVMPHPICTCALFRGRAGHVCCSSSESSDALFLLRHALGCSHRRERWFRSGCAAR